MKINNNNINIIINIIILIPALLSVENYYRISGYTGITTI